MIKTLKSELKLRPTYDEMIGMIEDADKENRPPIDKIIDRRATLFRNNQFGSQFDNIDFLGLRKQEEDRAKENVRQAQLREAGITARASTGTHAIGTGGFMTPAEVYEDAMLRPEPTPQEIEEIRTQLMAIDDLRRASMEQARSRTQSGLDEAHRQSLPVGVMDDMPPLVNIEEGEEEEDFNDDPELIPADDDESTKAPAQPRKHKETIDYSTKITKWQDKSVQEDDIRFQLFLRGIELTPEQEEEIAKLKVKGKGRNQTRKDYLINYIDRLIQTGRWTDQVMTNYYKKE